MKMVITIRILVLQMSLSFVLGQQHRDCTGKCDQTCYSEFSKYDANAFLSSGKRATPRECCHETYCEQKGTKCQTEQYRSYIVNKFSKTCSDGQVVTVIDWCPGHYRYECRDICHSLDRQRCENGGTCVPKGAHFTCSCMPGFTGLICQINIDDCTPDPCNISTSTRCIDGTNNYSCQCKPGYTGKNCTEDIDECASSPCHHDGTCVDHVNGYTCACAPGYTGLVCDIDIDECASSPCKDGATCNDKINRFTCDCPPRIYGVLCDTNICHPTPADVAFLLDSSVSMTEQEFKKQLEFVANFSSNVPIGPRDFQISVVTFSNHAHVEFFLDQYRDNSSLTDAIMNIIYKPGSTRTDEGLTEVKTVFSHGIERHINDTQAAKFVYVLTDGMSTYRTKTRQAAQSLKKVVDTVAAIGIGNEVSHQELIDIASGSSYVYSVKNFNSLYTVLKRLVHFDCDECENSAESDVAIFLDSSYSVTVTQYSESIDAIIHIIDVMKRFGINDTRVSVTSFSDAINSIIGMGETDDKDNIKSRLNMIAQSDLNATVPIENVYKHARTQIFNNTGSRNSAKNFLLIFTNGKASINDKCALEREKSLLETEDINVIAIGSGEDVDYNGLLQLVNDNFNVFITNNDSPMSNLDVLQSAFIYNKCDLKANE